MKHLIQYISYALIVIHYCCAAPAIISYSIMMVTLWLLHHREDRVPAKALWAEIVAYTKKVYE